MPDRVLGGRYRLISRLGAGGAGSVWTATDETLRREVAVKEIVLPDGLDPERHRVACERARREARAAALIDHPNVITVHDVLVEDGRPWIVMELIRGESLARAARAGLTPQQVARIGLQVLDALEAAHARGVLHRDVKPGNVLLDRDGQRAVLTDFGIAALDGDPALTSTGTFVGSPGYMAPERLREEPAGPESDLWSLGATLYTAVEGRAPFERDSPMAVLGAVLSDEPAPPRRAGSLGPLLWHLLRKNPDDRLPADVVRRVLRNVAEGRPSGLPDPAPPSVQAPSVTHPQLTAGTYPGAASPGAPHAGTPSRPRRVWPGVVVGVAGVFAVALVVAGVAVAASSNGKSGGNAEPAESTTPQVTRSTPRPAASPSVIAAPVDFCTTLTDRQTRRLLPGATPQRAKAKDNGCSWWIENRGLTVEDVNRLPDEPWPSSDGEAHTKFVGYRNQRAKGSELIIWGWEEIGVRQVRAQRSPASTLGGVGDEAFSYTYRGTSAPMDKAFVVFRKGKAVVEVEFTHRRGTGGMDDAVQAARWVATSLEGRA
ncbi:serine/threonine-protein kinase [Actinomadura sp. NPDC047616]|uniref:serine/threonine-protein kinase n=1 Tax=Actinomadura sp. NPDC047616 TaxID=3155914 RepID=UPI0033FEFB41